MSVYLLTYYYLLTLTRDIDTAILYVRPSITVPVFYSNGLT